MVKRKVIFVYLKLEINENKNKRKIGAPVIKQTEKRFPVNGEHKI